MSQKKKQSSIEERRVALQSQIDNLASNIDKVYMDKLDGLLSDDDFARIYSRVKAQRDSLSEKLRELDRLEAAPKSEEDQAKELVQRFIENATISRELLVSLIERIELTADREVIIKFRIRPLEKIQDHQKVAG